MTRLNLAKQIAGEAGEYLLKSFHSYKKPHVDYKANKELVTKYDKQAEKIILKKIKQNYPTDAILSEESGSNRKQSEYLWVIDPLDGTTNFVMGNPIFSVSIGIFYLPEGDQTKAQIVAGAIYWPVRDIMFTAEADKGARQNGKVMHVSKVAKLSDATLTFCHGSSRPNKIKAARYMTNLKSKGIDARQLGSAAIELALVAAGRTDSIVIPGVNPWDVAAGILMVREAGGRVTAETGKDWHLGTTNMIATNGTIHTAVTKFFKDA
ncbi:MAG: inositol monophosphatase [Candidatus Komeilibacteria bacterium]|nr:inositol monophosphatase [Candidatus Komeilibacteria bacterium]